VKHRQRKLVPEQEDRKYSGGRPKKVDENKLSELHSQGLNDKQISLIIECAETTVRIWRNKLGFSKNNPSPKGGRPRKVFDDIIRKIIEMNAQGYSDVAIAKALDLEVNTVWDWRNKRLRLPANTNSKCDMFEIMQKEGLTDKQIAKIAGVKVSTVGCWRFRSKKKEQAEGK
jgi:transposase